MTSPANAHEADSPAAAAARRGAYAVVFAFACGLLTAAVWRAAPLLSANDRSRWCTVWSLVERGTYRIDEIDAAPGWGTIDKVRHNEHFYSSKPPLLSTMVAGVYWVVRATTGWTLDEQTEETTRTILWIVNVLPMLAAIGVMIALVERSARTGFARVFVVAAFALATFLTTFTVTLNNHTVAALAVLFSLYPAARILCDGAASPARFALAGFFASFAAVNELPAAAFAVAVVGWLLYRRPVKAAVWAIPAALVPVAAFVWTTYLATGDWKPFYAFYGTDKYKYTVDGVPSYWMHPAGLDVNRDSPLVYFLHCTVGHHGIFSLSPVFLLTLAAWCAPRLSLGYRMRTWLWGAAGLTVVVIGFYLTRTQNYNYGGNTAGLRWTFWLIPLWLVSMIPVLDAMGPRWIGRFAACALLAVTAFSSWYAIANPWTHPWLFALMQRWSWIDYNRPREEFNRPVTTFFPLLPAEETGGDWIEYAGVDAAGGAVRLRLLDRGNVTQDGRVLRRIEATWSGDSTRPRTDSYLIDRAAFERGEPPARFLWWPKPEPDRRTRQAAETFLRGLSAPRRYHLGPIRYLKTDLQHNAFECRHAAAEVFRGETRHGPFLLDRVDVWLTADVPFGLLRFDQTVRDAETRELLSSLRMTAVAASRLHPQDGRSSALRLNIPGNDRSVPSSGH